MKVMKRSEALKHVGHAIDDAMAVRTGEPIPEHARLVGWQCGFEPMFVAVWSYLGVRLSDDEAEDIAREYLLERGWFSDPDADDNFADYVI